jgi:hypothetical protein
VSGITSRVAETSRQITDAQQQLDAAKKKYGAPFPEEGALNDAIAERGQLQSEMAAETKAKEEASKNPQPIQTEGAAGPLQSAGPEMGRREFIKGATAVAGGFMLHGKLYAKPAGLIAELAPADREAFPPRPKAASAAWKEQGGGLTVEDNGEKTMSPRAARIRRRACGSGLLTRSARYSVRKPSAATM